MAEIRMDDHELADVVRETLDSAEKVLEVLWREGHTRRGVYFAPAREALARLEALADIARREARDG